MKWRRSIFLGKKKKKTTCKNPAALQNDTLMCNWYELLNPRLFFFFFFFTWSKKKKTNTFLKRSCSKRTRQECKVSSIFALNQPLPNMLHHVRGRSRERASAAVILDCLSIVSRACGASFGGECCLNKTWSNHYAFLTKCNLPQRAKRVDRNVVISSSLLCKNLQYF